MSRPWGGRGRWPWMAIAAVVVIIAAAVIVAVVRSGGGTTSGKPSATGSGSVSSTAPRTSTSSTPRSPTSAASSATSAGTTSPSTTADPIVSQGYVPLYPFRNIADAKAWERSYRQGGHQPWHLSATMTAQSFVAYLRFTEIGRVTSHSVRADGAHIGVGYRNPAGALRTAAVLHLVRYGQDSLAPWEVVGTDDTTFTFDRPSYGAHVRSPLRVGGRISGVDENINVAVYQQFTQEPLGRTPHGTPAGGQAAPWSTTVRYSGGQPGAALIVAAWTGGHVQQVERFAINGLYA